MSEREPDAHLRDHFAAAALTGLLAQGDDGSFSEESYVRAAYRWADAMLRERERTNHDAAPAAIAEPCGKSDAQHPSAATLPQPADQGLGTGDTQEPVAWAVVYPNDEVAVIAFKRQDADERATASDSVVPLYRSPTLTDAEREAIVQAIGGEAEEGDAMTISECIQNLADNGFGTTGVEATTEVIAAEPKPLFVVIRSKRPLTGLATEGLRACWEDFRKLSPDIPPACVVGPEIEIEVRREPE